MTGLSLDRTSLEALADARRNARAALAALRALNLAAVHSDHCIELSRIGGTLADAGEDEATDAEDDGIRYLCRRKANYSARDWRRMRYADGVLMAEVQTEARAGIGPEYARDVVRRAVRKLADMGEHGVAATGSNKYLPRLARDYQLLERLSERQFAATTRSMRLEGELVMTVVGKYANRNPREGLTLVASPESAQEHCT